MKDLTQIFDEVYDYDPEAIYDGEYFRVEKAGKYNFADETGKVAFDDWFDQADDIMYADVTFADVERDGKYNMIVFDYPNIPRLLTDTWYDTPLQFVDDYERITSRDGIWLVLSAETGRVIRDATKDDLNRI